MAGMGIGAGEAGKVCMGRQRVGLMLLLLCATAHAAGKSAPGTYPPSNVGVWHNAIFAGAGSTAGVVRGNVDIHGSAHLLGANLAPGGVALEDSIDLSGTCLTRNNYAGIPAYLAARIPALETVNIDGTDAETLHGKLRVKKGFVGVNGNASIGLPHTAGSTVKQQMDGTYVTDGWSGNKTTPDGGRGIPSFVYSDNGWNELYDCGSLVAFPLMTDEWREPTTGQSVPRPNGSYYTHEEYFTEVLVGSPTNATDGIYTGNVVLDVSRTIATGAVYWNATTNTYLTGAAAAAATPGTGDDYFKFTPYASTTVQATLSMNGQIRINGTLSFTGGGGKDTVNYSGRCAFLATGDVNVDVRMLTCNNGVVTDTADSFPVNNCLGIMTKTNLNLGTGNGASQLDLMGAFYAQGTVTSSKQACIAGTVVANYFSITNNVPAFFQVPALADNLPLGMIGNYPILLYPGPGNVSAADIGTDRITWNWQDNSLDETGFKMWCDPGKNPPSTFLGTIAANSVSWQHTGLTPNTAYTFQVAATNASYDTARTVPLTAWTLAATPVAPVLGGATARSLTVSIGAGDGNPAGTEYLVRCQTTGQWVQADGTLGSSQVWRTAADWGTVTVPGLLELKKYYFAVTARNGAGKWSAGGPGAACVTLDGTPPTGTIVINNGAASTGDPNVTLSLTWSDGAAGTGVRSMRFSDDGAHWTNWEPVAAAKAYVLPAPNGYKTVRVQFADRAGNYSSRFSDYILLNAR